VNPMLLADNRFADGVVTATSTAAGYSPMHIIDGQLFTCYKSAGGGTQYLTVDSDGAKPANAIGLGGYNLHELGASVSVECSDDNFFTDITVASEPVAVEQSIFFAMFPQLTKRYWRLAITGFSGQCYIAMAVIGVVLEFEQPLIGDYTPRVIDPTADINISGEGHELGVVTGLIEQRSRWTFEKVRDSWFADNLKPVWDSYLKRGLLAFFIPTYSVHPDDVYLFFLDAPSGFSAPIMRGGRRRLGLDLRGVYIPDEVSVSLSLSYCAMVLADNPTHYWKMDETSGATLIDEIAANNGTSNGEPMASHLGKPPAVPCSVGSVEFGPLEVGFANELTGTSGSMEQWVYIPTGFAATQYLIYQKTAFTGLNESGKLLFVAINSSRKVRVSAGAYNSEIGNFDFRTLLTDDALAEETWHHIVITSDGTNWNIIVDGVEQSATLSGGGGVTPSDGTWFGYSTPAIETSFGSSSSSAIYVDQLSVYPTVITLARALEKYMAGVA